MGLFDFFNKNKEEKQNQYLSGFAKTNNAIGKKIRFIAENKTQNKEDFVENLMVTLIEADVGYKTADLICNRFFEKANEIYYMHANDVMKLLAETFKEIYEENKDEDTLYNLNGPTVILMVGVNGSGKTSTCAKLANMYLDAGKSVALVAGDTFRAGASEQLETWANRLNIACVKGEANQDPSSVLVEGCKYAIDNKIDILLCDTAGRLQNKTNLMNELAKMKRVISKQIDNAPINTWLVLDSNTGQNGLSQAELFNEITDLNGVILTKLDGTAKGGIVIAIKALTNIPVKFVTFGEGLNEIQEFDLDLYLDSIIGELKHAK